MMSGYENSKKIRRIASVVYLIIMAVIMTGTYLSQQQKEAPRKEARDLNMSSGFSEGSLQH